jgi:AraC-like DNA-binding protein/quercetin dioxygenase-like cupin family protein
MLLFIMIIEELSGVKHEEKGLNLQTPLQYHQKCYSEDSYVRMHYHSSYEINICENLQGSVNIEGTTHDLTDVKILFLPPDIIHSYRILKNSGTIKVWHIGLQHLEMVNHEVIDSLFQYDSYIISDNRVLMNSALEFLSRIDEMNGMSRTAGILQLLNLFYNPNRKNEGEKKLNPFLHKIIGWTESSFPEQITLDDAASAVNLSRYHFSRKFKAHTGSSYMNFLMKLRLENSLHQLNRGFSVSETAERSGFSDVSYFIKKFHSLYSQTPLQYQKNEENETLTH